MMYDFLYFCEFLKTDVRMSGVTQDRSGALCGLRSSQGSRQLSEFARFSFRVGLLFLSSFRLSNQTPKITQNFEDYASHCLSKWHHSAKKTKFWSKVCMNAKVTSIG